MSLVNMRPLQEIAEVEFGDIVVDAIVHDLNEMRIILKEGSFVDVWFSLRLAGRYSYHWERRAVDGKIYRHDNAPHRRWGPLQTFPRHFHDGHELNVKESDAGESPEKDLRAFLSFIRCKISIQP